MKLHVHRIAARSGTCALCRQRFALGEMVVLKTGNFVGETHCCSPCHGLFAELLVALRRADAGPVEYAGTAKLCLR